MTKLYDPVHQFIHLDDDEAQFMDTRPFQRLRFIRQMGGAFLVYPGATHSRFEHSLGVMEVATQIYDRAISKFNPTSSIPHYEYWRKVLRLAALFHDTGHLPFSHVAEHILLGPGGHERWTYAAIQSAELRSLWERLSDKYHNPHVIDDVCKIAIGEKKLQEMGHSISFTSWERMLSEIITGDFFGADRIDYLLRDSRCTGVSYGLFDYHQLIESIQILPTCRERGEDLELGIVENGIEACEALLLARHFMHRRVYQYPSVKSVNFHLARFMKAVYRVSDLDSYLNHNDIQIMNELFVALLNSEHPGHQDAKSILQRHHRFKAIILPPAITEESLIHFQKKHHISSHEMAWELVSKPSINLGLTFPVLLRSQKISPASLVSTLSIPRGSNSWAYIAPPFEETFIQTLTP